ncbi:hypothetical protein R1sor_026199 [Riccia sorocarpa]|uniref:Chlorophyllase n=1 Tax=Riccia sorocarpa TaxID=122646 RepID=A0ABD3GC64_9MARC
MAQSSSSKGNERRRVWQQLQLSVVVILVLIQSSFALDDIYNPGPHDADVFEVEQDNTVQSPKCRKVAGTPKPAGVSPPNRLFVGVPKQSGTYPVIHLQHAFTMKIDFYTQLLYHVATYGYIVVAPQMPQISLPDATMEIADGADTLDWYPNNLEALLAEMFPNLKVKPDLKKVILAGHSRGGKVAFGLATGVCKTVLAPNFVGVIGLDPVDGTGPGKQTTPKILPLSPYGLKLPFPTLIVGAGLGDDKAGINPPCAPLGVSHDAFFSNSAPIAYHFVASEYGHMDYLDDDLDGVEGVIANTLCRNGPKRAPMRKFTGGIITAFLNATLYGNSKALDQAILNIPGAAPVKLDTPQITRTITESVYASS